MSLATRLPLYKQGISSPLQIPGCALWLDAGQGLVENGSAQFTAANSEFLSIADNAALSTGAVDFWISGWAYLDSIGANRMIASKGVASHYEWHLYVTNGNVPNFEVLNPAGASLGLAIWGATVGASAWHHYFGYFDSVNGQVGISLDGGTFVTAVATAPTDDTAGFNIGARSGTIFWDGRIDAVAFGKSPVGGIAALATTIRDRLYNAGAGIPYSSLSTLERTAYGLVSWWELDEISGTRADQLGGNTLTDNATVTAAAGIVNKPDTTDGDPVAQWTDLSGKGRHFVQTTPSLRPLEKNAIQNGRPVVRFDGTDDKMTSAAILSNLATATEFTWFFAGSFSSSSTIFIDGAGTYVIINRGTSTRLDVQSYSAQYDDAQVGGYVSGVFCILTGIHGAGLITAFRNGLSGTPVAAAATADLTNTMQIDGGITSMDLGEIICYNRALSGAEISRVHRYLGARWGVSVQG